MIEVGVVRTEVGVVRTKEKDTKYAKQKGVKSAT
jgi:hypothetical protein